MSKKTTVSLGGVLALIIGMLIAFVTAPSDDADSDSISSAETVTTTVAAVSQESIETEPAADESVEMTPTETEGQTTSAETSSADEKKNTAYKFRTKKQLEQHYEKHGVDMGFASAAEYEAAASDVINSPDALFKTEAEDSDGVYYIEATNEFVILSTDGYIRTYFNPSGGKAYFDRQ